MEILFVIFVIVVGLGIAGLAAGFAHEFLGPPFDRADHWARSTRGISRPRQHPPP